MIKVFISEGDFYVCPSRKDLGFEDAKAYKLVNGVITTQCAPVEDLVFVREVDEGEITSFMFS